MEKTSILIEKANLDIFYFFNKLFGKEDLDNTMIFIDLIGDPHNIIFHIITIFALIFFILLREKNSRTFQILALNSIIAIITFFLSLSALALALVFKNYTEVIRPFCSLTDIHMIQTIISTLECEHSFPSGHMVFTTIITTSFWIIFNRTFKILSLAFIILTAITRMAAGAHYPIDLLGGLTIALPLTLYIRIIVTQYLQNNSKIINVLFRMGAKLNN